MSRKRNITGGIALIVVGFFGLTIYLGSIVNWGYPMWPGSGGSMMGRWGSGKLETVNGTVEKIEWMEIELEVNGKEVEVHGPLWFWQSIGIKEDDLVTAKGMFASMMQPGEGWHEEFIPFELTINGKTYGGVNKRVPVWMQ